VRGSNGVRERVNSGVDGWPVARRVPKRDHPPSTIPSILQLAAALRKRAESAGPSEMPGAEKRTRSQNRPKKPLGCAFPLALCTRHGVAVHRRSASPSAGVHMERGWTIQKALYDCLALCKEAYIEARKRGEGEKGEKKKGAQLLPQSFM